MLGIKDATEIPEREISGVVMCVCVCVGGDQRVTAERETVAEGEEGTPKKTETGKNGCSALVCND